MEATQRSTKATRTNRTTTISRCKFNDGRLQSIRVIRDTFTCTDGIVAIRFTTTVRMMVQSIEGRNYRMLYQNQSIVWETADGRATFFGTLHSARSTTQKEMGK